jgi:hypothetical protein
MDQFPRTIVGGVSVSRLVIGTNWMLGWSHTSLAWDHWIKNTQSRESIADVLEVFLNAGVDTLMGPPNDLLIEAVREAEQRAGRKMILALTPNFCIRPGGPNKNVSYGPVEYWPEEAFDICQKMGATFAMPHAAVTDTLMDKRDGVIRDLPKYTAMIRERGLIPGLSTHSPETPGYCTKNKYDIETYIQVYNAAGFLMHVEADWEMRVIKSAEKPCMCIKPLAAGRLLPAVGLAFVWNTIRSQDMVVCGTALPEEAHEVIELSLDYINHRVPSLDLQYTRSKAELKAMSKGT